jgi:hypothetical protein
MRTPWFSYARRVWLLSLSVKPDNVVLCGTMVGEENV